MVTSRIATLLASLLLIALWTSPALAGKNGCIKSCKQETITCIQADCASLGGKARRTCKRTCRAQAGCGGPRIRTLAYVVTECRRDADGFLVGGQSLRVRRGNCDPVTLVELRRSEPVADPIEICRLFGETRTGGGGSVALAFQRLIVSPDGSAVVFEITTDHSLFPQYAAPIPAALEGIFVVRADGTGMRSLGPASRDPRFLSVPVPGTPLGSAFPVTGSFRFSPNSKRIVFTDIGPGPAGEDAVQIVMLDVASGERTTLTRLPAAAPAAVGLPSTGYPIFVDNHTIIFATSADPDGSNPGGAFRGFSVNVDGTGLEALPDPVNVSGGQVIPQFRIEGAGRSVFDVMLPGTPENPNPPIGTSVVELFVTDGNGFLQLTNFHRVDTSKLVSGVRGKRVFFKASADPLGTNPSRTCQIFSIDTLGRRLRQLTKFNNPSATGCRDLTLPGCHVAGAFQDPVTGTVVFYSSCDPFGTNPAGGQIFAMHPNGSRLRQLTHTGAMVTHADGSLVVELPGPWSYASVD